MRLTWHQYVQQLLPRWLKGDRPQARALADTIADLLQQAQDVLLAAGYQASVLRATGSALDLIGTGRRMPRMANEADQEYRRRLVTAYQVYRRGGTVPGLVLALQSLGLADVAVIEGPRVYRYNGELKHNGRAYYRYRLRWAEFALRWQLAAGMDAAAVRQRVAAVVAVLKPAHAVYRGRWGLVTAEESMEVADE